MSYKLLASGNVQRLADGACIPSDPDNLDWQRYQEYLAAGGVPKPVDQPTQRQLVLAQLAAIDQAASAVRWIREFALGSNAGFTQIRDNVLPSLPTAGPGMVTLEQIEQRAIDLRKQLSTLP